MRLCCICTRAKPLQLLFIDTLYMDLNHFFGLQSTKVTWIRSGPEQARLKRHCKHKNLFTEKSCLQRILDAMLMLLHTHTNTHTQVHTNTYNNKNFTTIFGNHRHHFTHHINTSTETRMMRIQQEKKFRPLLGIPGK